MTISTLNLRSMRVLFVALLFWIELFGFGGPIYGASMYWIHGGIFGLSTPQLMRANLDGRGLETVLNLSVGARGAPAFDLTNQKLYWTEIDPTGRSPGRILRANLDGTEVEMVDIRSRLQFPNALAIEPFTGRVFWGDDGLNRIQRSNQDGREVTLLVTEGLEMASGIALDVANDYLYWIDEGNATIKRSRMNGRNVEQLVTTAPVIGNAGGSSRIAIDIEDGVMYWDDKNDDKIYQANLDGSNVKELLDLSQIYPNTFSGPAPSGIALDKAREHIYLSNSGSSSAILRANLDGSEVVELLGLGGFANPSGITLILEPDLQAGDANQDLEFNSSDLISVFQAGKYETGQPASWAEGDWNEAPGGFVGYPPRGNGVFDSSDLVAAFRAGVFEKGPYVEPPMPANVPEPHGVVLLVVAFASMVIAVRTFCRA